MNGITPVYDFVREYVRKKNTRFHMPGHKGHVFLGCEPLDITEIEGADVLYHADGILKESQNHAASLFGSGRTCYSTEGSSLCIKAMLAVVTMGKGSDRSGQRKRILAARNVHRSMIDACALLDLDVEFILDSESDHLCTSHLKPAVLRENLERAECLPAGVYVTSPDYLGTIADIAGLAQVCNEYGIPLLVDNAHGAYLGFLEQSCHPIVQGAALCCDSAHKTLPVLTGGAYLHVAKEFESEYGDLIPKMLALFGSTSPSYLILQSLDLCNRYLAEGYREKLDIWIDKIDCCKEILRKRGIPVAETEPLKIVIESWRAGYTGEETAEELRKYGIECEYADRQYVVLMVTPENVESDLNRLEQWSSGSRLLEQKMVSLKLQPVRLERIERACSIREAVFGESEMVPVSQALGRICAAETVSCPPAVPVAVSGERITEEMIKLLQEYEIKEVAVMCLSTGR